MRYFLFIAMLLGLIPSFSQIESKNEELGRLFCGRIEKAPQVDTAQWHRYLTENLELDSIAQDSIPEGSYHISVMFIIDKEGCIYNVQIRDNPGYGLGEKVVRVVSGYTSKWIPAEINGRKVRGYKKQIVTIVVLNKRCKANMPGEFIL